MVNSLKEHERKFFTVRNMSSIGMLSALAAVVMIFEIPLWFAPEFYKIDLSEVIVLIGAFALGPIEGVIIEFLKVVINTIFTQTTTGYVGETANFIVGCFFILPASLIYHRKKTMKSAIVGLVIGTLSLALAGSLMNYYVLLPLYSKIYGMPMEAFIGAGTEKNKHIMDLKSFIMLAVVPFNLLKGVLSSLITFAVYKKISRVIHK